MRKYSELTEEQKKLIDDNFHDIREILSIIFMKALYYGNNYVDEALSFLPDITQEYNEALANGFPFKNFAIQRCIFRYIDQFRRMNKHRYIVKNDKKIADDPMTPILRKMNSFFKKGEEKSDNNIVGEKVPKLTQQKLLDDFIHPQTLKQISIDSDRFLYENEMVEKDLFIDKGFEEVDWNDLRSTVLEKSKGYFKNYKSGHIYTILLKEYLFPKCMGEKYDTLKDISRKVGRTEGRLSQMMKDNHMKAFISRYCVI